jgi:serine/threonine-protein kinase
LKQRYATADELLYDLEFYIYSGGYGPTNETLGKFVRELFGMDPAAAVRDAKGSTRLLERTARVTRSTTRNARHTHRTRNTKKTIRIA